MLRERVTRTDALICENNWHPVTRKYRRIKRKAEKQQLTKKIRCCHNWKTVPNTWPYFCPTLNGESDHAKRNEVKIHQIFLRIIDSGKMQTSRELPPCHRQAESTNLRRESQNEWCGLTNKGGREYQVAADDGFTDCHDDVSKQKRAIPKRGKLKENSGFCCWLRSY